MLYTHQIKGEREEASVMVSPCAEQFKNTRLQVDGAWCNPSGRCHIHRHVVRRVRSSEVDMKNGVLTGNNKSHCSADYGVIIIQLPIHRDLKGECRAVRKIKYRLNTSTSHWRTN